MNIFIQITSPHTILQLCLSTKAARRAFEQIHQDVEQLAVLVVQVPRDGCHLIAQTRLHHLGERHTEITQEADGVGVSLQHQEITVCQGDCCSPAIILVGRREQVRSMNGVDILRLCWMLGPLHHHARSSVGPPDIHFNPESGDSTGPTRSHKSQAAHYALRLESSHCFRRQLTAQPI